MRFLPATSLCRKGKAYVLSDVTLLFSEKIPKDEFEEAEQFLEMLSEVYYHLPKPETTSHDWPEILQKSPHNLQHNPGCWQQFGQKSFLNAYVSDYDTPPETMVQLAVLLPIMDYAEWSRNKCRWWMRSKKTLLNSMTTTLRR